MKCADTKDISHLLGRSPQRERGLKFRHGVEGYGVGESLPSEGAWIEITTLLWLSTTQQRRSPQRERGLKLAFDQTNRRQHGRSPQRERGLKFKKKQEALINAYVAPLRGSVD